MLDSESSLDTYKVVGGLDMDAYLEKVQSVYDAACNSITDYEKALLLEECKGLEQKVCRETEDIEFLSCEIEKLSVAGGTQVEHNIGVLLREAEDLYMELNQLIEQVHRSLISLALFQDVQVHIHS